MQQQLNLPSYTGKEQENISFFMLPKILFENEQLKNLSLKAKVIYSLLRDRVSLSIQNNWIENGEVYIKYTQEKLALKTSLSIRTVGKLLKELKENGLIDYKKKGYITALTIIVKNLNPIAPTEDKYQTSRGYTKDSKSDNENDSTVTAEMRIHELEQEILKLKAENEILTEENHTLKQTIEQSPDESETSSLEIDAIVKRNNIYKISNRILIDSKNKLLETIDSLREQLNSKIELDHGVFSSS